MNQLEVRNLIRQEIRDQVKSAEATDQLRWTRAILCTQINLSANFVAQEFKHIQGVATFSTADGTNSYAFAASDSFMGYSASIVYIRSSDGSNWDTLYKANYVDFSAFMLLEEDSSTTFPPSYWSLWNQKLYIENPSYSGVNNLEVYMAKNQTELATDGTDDAEEMDGDTSLHQLIVYHAAVEMARQDQQVNLTQLLESKYKQEYDRQIRHHAPPYSGAMLTTYRDF